MPRRYDCSGVFLFSLYRKVAPYVMKEMCGWMRRIKAMADLKCMLAGSFFGFGLFVYSIQKYDFSSQIKRKL